MRVSNNASHKPISKMQPFTGSNMYAECRDSKLWYTGYLPAEWAERLAADAPTYVVFSYSTPIAWVAADGRAVIPPVSYSNSTSKHQNYARHGLMDLTGFGYFLDGVLVPSDTPVVYTGRKYRSRLDSERQVIRKGTIAESYTVEFIESRGQFSDVRAEAV
jgi:hypothetical protein